LAHPILASAKVTIKCLMRLHPLLVLLLVQLFEACHPAAAAAACAPTFAPEEILFLSASHVHPQRRRCHCTASGSPPAARFAEHCLLATTGHRPQLFPNLAAAAELWRLWLSPTQQDWWLT